MKNLQPEPSTSPADAFASPALATGLSVACCRRRGSFTAHEGYPGF
jgi:hypothetical protein